MIEIELIKKAIRNEKTTKYNPYHDKLGRFTTADGTMITVPYKPKTSSKQQTHTSVTPSANTTSHVQTETTVDTMVQTGIGFSGESMISGLDTNAGLSSDTNKTIKSQVESKINELKLSDERIDIDIDNVLKKATDGCLEKIANGESLESAIKSAEEYIESEASTAIGMYCKKKVGCQYNDKVSQDTKLMLDFIDGISKAEEILGETKMLSLVGPANDKYQEKMKSWGANATTDTSGSKTKIITNSDSYGVGSKLFDNAQVSDFNTKGYSATSVGAHEYTHAYERHMAHEIAKNKNKGEQCYRDGDVARTIIERASENIGKPKEEAVAEVSGYAKFDSSEAFAECISDYCVNGENAAPLSKEVANVLQNERKEIIKEVKQRMRR